MYKHYIRLEGQFIVKAFSDVFVTPEAGDICINENANRHFNYQGKTNPDILDGNGFSKYKYVGDSIVPATPGEQSGYADFIAAEARASDIVDAQATSGVRGLTIEQAIAYINNSLNTSDLDATGVAIDNATDLATLRTAIKASIVELRALVVKEKEVLLKMVPYLLG